MKQEDVEKKIAEARKSMSDFKRREQIHAPAERMRMAVLTAMVMSVVTFTIMGKPNVQPIILPWAGVMTLAVLSCVVMDMVAARKIKKEGL